MIIKPIIYLDTNVCRDCINKNRSKVSKESIHLLETIREKKWDCITSTFTFMELYDIEKEDLFFNKKLRYGLDVNRIIRDRNHKDLTSDDLDEVNERISEFHNEYNFIKFHALDGEEGWKLAKDVSRSSNLSAPDSIHLAVALGSGCNLIITSDEPFLQQAAKFLQDKELWNNVRICKPSEAISIIDESFKIKPTGKAIYYEESFHLNNSSPFIKELYKIIKEKIKSWDSNISVKITKKYIAFHHKINFISVLPQKSSLKLYFMKKGKLIDPAKYARDVSKIGHYGQGDYELNIKNARSLAYALFLLNQAYTRTV